MLATGIASGHALLSDWLFLIAAIVAGLYAWSAHMVRAESSRLIPSAVALGITLALIAVGLMVL